MRERGCKLEIFKQIAYGFDVGPMVAALYENHEVWDHIKARQETPGSAHSETKTIFLRWAKSQTVDAAFNEVEAVDYPALKVFPEAGDLIRLFSDMVKPTELGRVIITSLKPFGMIEPHIDEGEYPDHFQRFHIPISCGPGSIFCGRGEDGKTETAKMRPGDLWWFDNKKTHWVENMCDTPRVHMIFDAVVPGYERPYDISK